MKMINIRAQFKRTFSHHPVRRLAEPHVYHEVWNRVWDSIYMRELADTILSPMCDSVLDTPFLEENKFDMMKML